ncbi:MAG: tetratricopeptide repeat protein [Bryobacteraceae bacterium]
MGERVTVGVLASTPLVCSELQACLKQLPVQVVLDERVIRPDPALLSHLQSLHPELLLVEQPAELSTIQALLRTVAKATPASAIVVVNGNADPEAILEAVRSGARDYLYVPFGDSLGKVIGRLQAARPKPQSGVRRPRGRVIGFLSAKGGCGATTVALHAAVGMARESGQPTGLADFDLSCGMVKFLTNSRSQYTVLDAATNASRLDESFWNALVTECSGIEVLTAPAPLAAKQYPEPAQFGATLDFMRSRYAWSLVDLGRGIHSFPASLLEHFDEIYVVATPDRIALAQAKRVADCLRHGCSFRTVRLIVNRSPAAAVVEIERLTGLDVYATIVDAEKDLHDALADSRLVSEKAQISRQMGTFARRVAGLPAEAQAPETATGLVSGFRKMLGRVRQATQGRAEDAGATPDSAWETLSRNAEAAFKNGQFDLAARHLAQAVEEARSFGDGDLRFGRSLNRLGVVQCHQGRHAEAERSLKTAAKILEQVLGEADPSVLEVLSNLAGVYKATRQYETARQLYEAVLKTGESALGPKHTMVAWTLDGLGDVHLAQGEPTAALYAYRRALSIKEQTLGLNDWDVAVTLDKISEFYHAMGRYNEAEPLLWRSIEIRTAVLGRGSSALAKHFLSLGTMYAAQRRYPEAERVLRYGIAITPADERVDDMTPSLHKLAEVCEGQARFGEAESIREVARQIVSSGADSAKVLAREFGASASMVPNAPRSLRAGWAQTSF